MRSPELAHALRSARPVASDELRQQVLALAAERTPSRRGLVLAPPRRAALVAIAALLAVAVGGALLEGIVHSGAPTANRHGPVAFRSVSGGSKASAVPLLRAASPERSIAHARSPSAFQEGVPTLPGRLQQYGAYLRVQVRDVAALSDATKRAIRFARLLGGYVAYVRYATPAQGGAAALIVRVPVDRVQDALQEYSSLGTILAQNLSLLDVTDQVLEQAKEIARLRTEIARLEAGPITPVARARIEADGARLAYLTKRRAATVARAQLARVALELTTRPRHAAPASRFNRTLSGAGGVLLREAELLLYALIVAGPLLVLAGAGIGAARFVERRRESQLLARS
ncbi:MAG TPA: DUF4349 domain-containing protein [Gaiellaceae bacterium]